MAEDVFMWRFYALLKDVGFTGSIGLGTVAAQRGGFRLEEPDIDGMNVDSDYTDIGSNTDGESDDSDDEEDEKEDEKEYLKKFKLLSGFQKIMKDNELQVTLLHV